MKAFKGFTALVKCGLIAAASLAGAEAMASVSINVSSGTVSENAGSVRVTIRNHEDAQVGYSYWTVNGSAVGGSDFQAMNGSVTIPMFGTTSFYLPIYNDSAVEGNETFEVCVGWGFGGSPEDCASVTIVDDDSVTSGVSFKISDASAVESDGTMTFAVTRTGNDNISHSISYATANGTASSSSDYYAKSGTLTFTPTGPSTQYITVNLRNGIMIENVEYFYVNLSGLTGGGSISDSQGRGTIIDDDESDDCGADGRICP
ncbi:MAG: Calx-beta domain-containing protein [Permianibacter sp.]